MVCSQRQIVVVRLLEEMNEQRRNKFCLGGESSADILRKRHMKAGREQRSSSDTACSRHRPERTREI
jgi:hypothetical protein